MSHLYQRGDVYWLTFYKNGKRFFQSLNTKDRTTALYLKSKADKELVENKYIIHDPNMTCDIILKEYEAACQNRKIRKTILNDTARIKAFLNHGNIRIISQVTEKRLQEYLNARIADKITLSSANRFIATIKAWVNFAVRRKYILDNPLKDFRKYRAPQNPPKYLTHDEVKKLLDAARESRFYVPIVTALYTGMRYKEILYLEWSDINFEANTIIVRNKEGFTTKSKKYRTIPLHPTLCGILEPLKLKEGRCFDMSNHKRLFPKIVQAAGLKGVGFHHMRHTFASNLAMSGVDLYTISQVLGHSTITVTQQYSHLTKDHMRGAVEKLKFPTDVTR